MFLFGKIAGSILLPPGSFLLLILLALILLLRGGARKFPALLLSIALVSGFTLSIHPVSALLLGSLEGEYPPFEAPGSGVKPRAIVVLGGGYVEMSPEYGGRAALKAESLARAAYGAALRERTGLPLIFTGGQSFIDPGRESEADAALRFWRGLGIEESAVLLEKRSRDTFENARFTGDLLGGGPVILVTSAWHMPRAVLSFRKAGLEVLPAPTAFRVGREPFTILDFLPSEEALGESRLALHELLGLAWYAVAK